MKTTWNQPPNSLGSLLMCASAPQIYESLRWLFVWTTPLVCSDVRLFNYLCSLSVWVSVVFWCLCRRMARILFCKATINFMKYRRIRLGVTVPENNRTFLFSPIRSLIELLISTMKTAIEWFARTKTKLLTVTILSTLVQYEEQAQNNIIKI